MNGSPVRFRQRLLALGLIFAGAVIPSAGAADAPGNAAPEGFVPLFNGNDLTGWHGLGPIDPSILKTMGPKKRTAKLAAADADMKKHWRVDNGEIVNDGSGVLLTTDKDYGDFELWIEWKMVAPNGDSGIFLRGYPQVQIWDPANPNEVRNGAPKGSGGLWNNNPGNPGRFPLVKADRPVGQWNSLRIRMVGQRVTVRLNDQRVVDDAVMNNVYHRKEPILPRGPIQLQTHGSEMRFRNVFLRELPADASTKDDAKTNEDTKSKADTQ